ncbi:hypothetical protein LAZ67_14001564 [Cordylochernes scorpioides]|uniref:Uncharacterized protein n=1 Tax=Cordylochernes scorpioides TaxID=51811 RepID=A0ABY6L705_9ARAC|nr:hypothetical protein LAZ67_14001564 [Cordylochernes scorpioides]
MKLTQVGLRIAESKLPDMELAEKPGSTGQDLTPVEDNQSPVAASGEKVPRWSPRPQREKPRSTRQDVAPVGDNQSPVAASGGKVPSRSLRPQRSRRPPDQFDLRNISEIKSYLASISFYGKYIPKLDDTFQILYKLTRKYTP